MNVAYMKKKKKINEIQGNKSFNQKVISSEVYRCKHA